MTRRSHATPPSAPTGAAGGPGPVSQAGGERLLYLTDEQLRQGAELMYFAYRAFTSDADEILTERGFGRAHHRALHFIGARADLTVADLIEILGVTKQSLNRVLRELVDKGLVSQRVGAKDRRQRHLALTDEGAALERAVADAQRARVRRAFREAGPDAVAGFRTVLEGMLDPESREALIGFVAEKRD
ncbi:MAG: MarR family transcriptional regulator [Pseudomonadota bacterium]